MRIGRADDARRCAPRGATGVAIGFSPDVTTADEQAGAHTSARGGGDNSPVCRHSCRAALPRTSEDVCHGWNLCAEWGIRGFSRSRSRFASSLRIEERSSKAWWAERERARVHDVLVDGHERGGIAERRGYRGSGTVSLTERGSTGPSMCDPVTGAFCGHKACEIRSWPRKADRRQQQEARPNGRASLSLRPALYRKRTTRWRWCSAACCCRDCA
jgi:hypothetical protein